MSRLVFVVLCSLVSASATAQVTVLGVERLSLPAGTVWLAPHFSPNGAKVYLTSSGYNGIWECGLKGEKLRKLTSDRGSGFGYALSRDGSQIAYRRTTVDSISKRRKQELLTLELATGKSTRRATGKDLSLPTFAGQAVAYSTGEGPLRTTRPIAQGEISLLGIELTKIALIRAGQKVLLDPFGNGSYIWPALSPDRTRLVAYEMTQGTFICDLDGKVLSRLGRRDAPAWTRDGRWIVFMKQMDDGHRLLSSDLYMISSDGKTVIRLTDTPEILELYPQCSPTENRIAYSTASGEVRMITFAEAGQ